ncbi:hypothetical protein [Amycolatopsis sp. NPDC102389]|uniref:hypothetical protein n=1 Tax=Amycolatopsis sp. NPDC102389 TaxID=3363941 RepID=UPI003809D907
MVVQRIGSGQTAAPKPAKNLGCVLVTIDDLDALMHLLSRNSTSPTLPVVEFAGGSFDEAADIRLLSDAELRQLTIKTDLVEVVLAEVEARAIGDEEESLRVCTEWAQSRRTKISRLRSLDRWEKALSISMFLTLLAGAAGSLLSAIFKIKLPGEPDPSFFTTWPGAAFFPALLLGFIIALMTPATSGVIIKPVTLARYREDQTVGNRHWQTATISLSAVVVALTGWILTLLIKK